MALRLIVPAAFTIAVLSLPTWAASFWQEVARERATTTYAGEQFLYAARPNPRNCVAGTLTQRTKDRALHGMNRIRALHGLAPVRYSSLYDRSVQEAALIQAANGFPGHHPPPRARCYTTAGAQASRTGNLSGVVKRGQTFLDRDPVHMMIGWANDARNLNLIAAVGHRRWLLNPFATYMSYGQVYGHAVQKTFDFDHEPALTPFVTVDYVAFPYETYPAALMEDDPPWSFSVIEDKRDIWANQYPYFENAGIRVVRPSDGASLVITDRYTDTEASGVPNLLSWQVEGWEYDTPYHVTIRNVGMQTRQLRSYSYRVYIERAGGRGLPTRSAQERMRVKQEREALTFPARQPQVPHERIRKRPIEIRDNAPRIVDADTLEMDGQRVRLQGIDAPESAQTCRQATGQRHRCGDRATEALRTRIGGGAVRCTIEGRDRDNRALSRCYTEDGTDLNAWLVRQGYALAYRHYTTTTMYVPEEDQARAARAGIWADEFVPPWAWRRGQRLD